jgi:hypothetical protein
MILLEMSLDKLELKSGRRYKLSQTMTPDMERLERLLDPKAGIIMHCVFMF